MQHKSHLEGTIFPDRMDNTAAKADTEDQPQTLIAGGHWQRWGDCEECLAQIEHLNPGLSTPLSAPLPLTLNHNSMPERRR